MFSVIPVRKRHASSGRRLPSFTYAVGQVSIPILENNASTLAYPNPATTLLDPNRHDLWHAAPRGSLEQRFKLIILVLPPD